MKKVIIFAGLFIASIAVVAAQLPNGDGGNHKDKPGDKVAESSGTSALNKKDYRIERQEERGMSRIRILSPEGKVLRNFAFGDVRMAKSGRYLLHQSTYAAYENKGYTETVNNFYTVKGEKKWTKTFRSYPASWDPEMLDPSMGQEGLSDNGDRSYYNWRNEDGKYCMAVYDEVGKELARTCVDTGLYKIEMSPDGKLLAAETYVLANEQNVKHWLFVEVDTGKIRLVNAEIVNGGARAYLLSNKKIQFWIWKTENKSRHNIVEVEFYQLRDNVSDMAKK